MLSRYVVLIYFVGITTCRVEVPDSDTGFFACDADFDCLDGYGCNANKQCQKNNALTCDKFGGECQGDAHCARINVSGTFECRPSCPALADKCIVNQKKGWCILVQGLNDSRLAAPQRVCALCESKCGNNMDCNLYIPLNTNPLQYEFHNLFDAIQCNP